MPELDQRIIGILEDNDWTIHEITETGDTGRFSYYVEIETYSNLGEDFIETIYFDGTNEGFIDGIEEDYEDFDPEEHATMWYETHGKNGAPTSLRTLLEDAYDLDAKLVELCFKLNNLDFVYEKINLRRENMNSEEITFYDNGIDYKIADHGEGKIFFEFEGNCYGMNYATVAGLIRGGLELVNSIETEI